MTDNRFPVAWKREARKYMNAFADWAVACLATLHCSLRHYRIMRLGGWQIQEAVLGAWVLRHWWREKAAERSAHWEYRKGELSYKDV